MVTREEDSVRIRYFDKKSVEESLREYLKEIEEKHPEVKRVLLFGSFVRNETVPGSDIDYLNLFEIWCLRFEIYP